MAHEIVGIVGTSASGKNTGAEYLEAEGYLHFDTGEIVRQEAIKRFSSEDQAACRQAGHELRQELGGGALALLAIHEYKKRRTEYEGLVVSGMRAFAPAQTIADNKGLLIYVDAPVEQRFERLVLRGRNGESKTLKDFVIFEEEEITGTLNTGQNLSMIADISHIHIYNDGDIADYLAKISNAVGITPTALAS
ncbi:AAA family ATPase [Candidatus Saccharibacteria bacterium]|nr:AAA family ATPase [Candidatus Saccharibacteria bacterium]